jgi:hypothetical protein
MTHRTTSHRLDRTRRVDREGLPEEEGPKGMSSDAGKDAPASARYHFEFKDRNS